MSQEQLTTLSKIYNTLMLINTKGEDTMIMAECIKALQSVLNEAAQEIQPQEKSVEEIEE